VCGHVLLELVTVLDYSYYSYLRSHGKNLCDTIIVHMISGDTQTNSHRKCKAV